MDICGAVERTHPSNTKLPDFLLGLLGVFVEDVDDGFLGDDEGVGRDALHEGDVGADGAAFAEGGLAAEKNVPGIPGTIGAGSRLPGRWLKLDDSAALGWPCGQGLVAPDTVRRGAAHLDLRLALGAFHGHAEFGAALAVVGVHAAADQPAEAHGLADRLLQFRAGLRRPQCVLTGLRHPQAGKDADKQNGHQHHRHGQQRQASATAHHDPLAHGGGVFPLHGGRITKRRRCAHGLDSNTRTAFSHILCWVHMAVRPVLKMSD